MKKVTSGIKTQFLKNLLAGILLMTSGICFGQDNLNESELIEFNYTTKTLNKVLPFDDFFSIKLVDIPESVENVIIRFYEYDIKKFKFTSGKKICPEDLKDWLIIYETQPWERTGTEKSGEIPVTYKLKPSRKYVVEIGSEKKALLTDTEKVALSTALKQDKEVQDIINTTAKRFLEAPDGMTDYGSLSVTQREFMQIATKAVLKVNLKYRVNPIDLKEHLVKLLKFVSTLDNGKEDIDFVKTYEVSITDEEKRSKFVTAFDKLKASLGKINWATATSEDLKIVSDEKQIVFNLLPSSEMTKQSIADIDEFLKQILVDRTDWLNIITANAISQSTYILSTLGATYRADFVKNAKLYVTLDLGAAYVGNIDRVLSYSGVNIYLRPINKNVPFSYYSGWKEQLAVRTSFLIGVTMNSIEKANVRKGLIGNTALVLGVGIRPVSFMKINGGCMMYYKYANNPLISQENYHFAMSPFVSLSVDLDAKSLFGGIGEALFK